MLALMPLLTAAIKFGIRGTGTSTLTGDVSAVLELGGHHGVHRDHHVSLLRHQLVAVLDLHGDPLLEGLIDDRSADVDDPLLRRLREVLVVWEEGLDEWDVGDELENPLDAQTLVLRDVEC